MKSNKAPKILVVGSFVMDLIVSSNRFPNSGETVIGHGFNITPGGKGANQAIQAARLGAEVTIVGKVGNDDFGKRLIESAEKSGVNIKNILIDNTTFSAVGNVQLETGGERTVNRICVVPGANMALTVSDVEFLQTEIINYDMVILQLEIPMVVNKAVAKYAKENNVPVMLNTAPYAQLDNELLANVTYISPNEHEASLIAETKIESVKDAESAVKYLYKKYSVKSLITLGKNGAVYGDGKAFFYKSTVEAVKTVDPTAAGDSFVSAFCVALCSGLAIENALEFGNYVASLTVTKMGAQNSLPTKSEVKKFILEQIGSIKDFINILGE